MPLCLVQASVGSAYVCFFLLFFHSNLWVLILIDMFSSPLSLFSSLSCARPVFPLFFSVPTLHEVPSHQVLQANIFVLFFRFLAIKNNKKYSAVRVQLLRFSSRHFDVTKSEVKRGCGIFCNRWGCLTWGHAQDDKTFPGTKAAAFITNIAAPQVYCRM